MSKLLDLWLKVLLILSILSINTGPILAQTFQQAHPDIVNPKSSDPQLFQLIPASGYLSNENLSISLLDSGQFTMQTADGRYLLYPKAQTGFLSIKVDNQVYNNKNGSLIVITPFTVVNNSFGYIQYRTPENVRITQNFILNGPSVQFKVEVVNQDSNPHVVAARYLFDTQISINDGSPLYAPSVGVRTYETDMVSPTFNSWRGYDFWPNPNLTSIGTFATQPNRIVFAWWPKAVESTWDYTPNSNQQFYTPGKTSTPDSDSCVLLYFNLGTLLGGSKNNFVTYYGVGEPVDSNQRERLLSAFQRMKEAVKSSVIADLDGFSSLQAKYLVSLRLDWKDYLEVAWTIASLTVVPSPNKLAKLGKDAKTLEKLAETISYVDLGNTVGKGLAETLSDIPSTASEQQVKTDYIYARFMNQRTFTPGTGGTYVGVAGYLTAIEAEYQDYIAKIPDPLPANYPVDFIVNSLEQQIAALNASAHQATFVPFYTSNACNLYKLGELQIQKGRMDDLEKKMEWASKVSFYTTLTEMSAVLGGAGLKIAGVVGTPVTLGTSTIVFIPSEVMLWGGVAKIVLISSAFNAISSNVGLSIQGAMTSVSYQAIMQFANDLAVRHKLFQDTGNWITNFALLRLEQATQSLAQASVQIESINTPNLTIPENEMAGRGTGEILIKNTGSTLVNVNVYGSITTELNQQVATVNLVGSGPVNIAPGTSQAVKFSYTLLSSSLLHHAGYDIHIYVTAVNQAGVTEIKGPYVSHFYVGTGSQLAILNSQNFQSIVRGAIETGLSVSNSVQFSSPTRSGRLLLSFAEGSDADLHLYNNNGNHVGVNYTTGVVENQISGVTYSGPNSWPEWINIENPGSVTYQVKIVAQNTAGGREYDLSKFEAPVLPAILDSPAHVTWYINRTNKLSPTTESYDLQVAEGGGSQAITNLEISATNLTDGNAMVIAAAQLSCNAPSEILAGNSISANCSITIPSDVPVGSYEGTIQIRGKNTTGSILLTNTTVTITLGELGLSAEGIPGDCNGDRAVGASDITALALEFFDGDDNNNPAATPGGTYPGTPACDANQDTRIGASDITCIALLFFNGAGACNHVSAATVSASPVLSIPDQVSASPNSKVTVPIVLQANGSNVSSLFLFSLDYDETHLSFDPTDNNQDGIPDTVTFNLPEQYVSSVTFDSGDTNGELDVMLASFAATPAALTDGVLLAFTLNAGAPTANPAAVVNFAQEPLASFGDPQGHAIPGTTDNGSVLITVAPDPAAPQPSIYLPFVAQNR